MKPEITLGQLLSVASALLIAMATGWITMTNKVARQDEKMEAMRTQWMQERLDFRKDLDHIKYSNADMQSKLTDILIKLENKQNRK